MKLTITAIGILFASLLWAQPNSPTGPLDNPYPESIEYETQAIPKKEIREADVFWKKRIYRRIMVNEKFNHKFIYNADQYSTNWAGGSPDAKPFYSFIKAKIEEGVITPYKNVNFETFTQDEEDRNQFCFGYLYTDEIVDTVTMERVKAQVPAAYDPRDVKAIRVKEDWYFDEQHSVMRVDILAIGFDFEAIPGRIAEQKGKFWLYYPEIRDVLAKEYVYNEKNDAIRYSWDAVFQNRMFSSYIYKESNIFERSIAGSADNEGGYRAGVKAIIEGERIQQTIREKEMMLWSY